MRAAARANSSSAQCGLLPWTLSSCLFNNSVICNGVPNKTIVYHVAFVYLYTFFHICKISDLPTPLKSIFTSTMETMEETLNFSNIVQSRAYYRILHYICPRIHPCTCMILLRQKHSVAKPTSENAGGGGLISSCGCLSKKALVLIDDIRSELGWYNDTIRILSVKRCFPTPYHRHYP